MIISAYLTGTIEEQLLRVLKDNKETFGWTIHDIKGINPSICTYKIYIEEVSMSREHWLNAASIPI